MTNSGDSCIGLKDKLYWRRILPGGLWHCFKRTDDAAGASRWVSLCDRFTLVRSGGQACNRPNPWARCPICDGAEMARRGWDESGPTLVSSLEIR